MGAERKKARCEICNYELCSFNGKRCYKHKIINDITKEKMRVNMIGNNYSKGVKRSKEFKQKLSEINKGSKHPQWKGGITKNKKYRSWIKNKRNRVIKRLKIESLSHTWGEWENLKKQYGFICPCCKKSEQEIKLTEDHIIPLSKGGSDLIENIQPLYQHCNFVKHTLIIKY